MKKILFTPITAFAVVAATMFSCAGPNEANNTGLEPTEVVVTETEVATETLADGTEVVVSDTDVRTETVMAPEKENLANNLSYDDMYKDVVDTEQYNLLSLLRMNPRLSTFVKLVELSGLAPSLMTTNSITVFAPANEAFNNLPQERLNYLVDPANRAELIKFINMHILPQEVASIEFEKNDFIDRGAEEDIPVNVLIPGGEEIYVGGALIVVADIEASNGVLHVLDDVIEVGDRAGADID